MNPLDVILTALSSLASNKLRAALTLLGIVIGVTAVIVLISLGQGVQKSITSEFESLGTNLITVTPAPTTERGSAHSSAPEETNRRSPWTTPTPCSTRQHAVDSRRRSRDQHLGPRRIRQKRRRHHILGVTADYDDVRLYAVEQGDFISPVHVRDTSSVAVLGAGISESLFGLRNPVGQTLKLNDKPFTIIGVLESKRAASSAFWTATLWSPLPLPTIA